MRRSRLALGLAAAVSVAAFDGDRSDESRDQNPFKINHLDPSKARLDYENARAQSIANDASEYRLNLRMEWNNYVTYHLDDLLGKNGTKKQNVAMLKSAQLKSTYDGSSLNESYEFYSRVRVLGKELQALSANDSFSRIETIDSNLSDSAKEAPIPTKTARKSRYLGGPVEK